jgi:hypothetical protein
MCILPFKIKFNATNNITGHFPFPIRSRIQASNGALISISQFPVAAPAFNKSRIMTQVL